MSGVWSVSHGHKEVNDQTILGEWIITITSFKWIVHPKQYKYNFIKKCMQNYKEKWIQPKPLPDKMQQNCLLTFSKKKF